MAITGPAGSGKSRTSLDIAEALCDGNEIVVVGTQNEDSTAYADTHPFDVLHWDPPFDPRELAATIRDLSKDRCRGGVVVVDSASPFYSGQGGTLDIANAPQGGWRVADSADGELIRSILDAPCHIVLCVRVKTGYEISEASGRDGINRPHVDKLGLAPIQRADFEYELGVVVSMDMDHRITVSKARGVAELDGRTFAPHHQGQLAETYAEWLKAGEQLATQSDIDALSAAMAAVDDQVRRARIKQGFVYKFGEPVHLVESQIQAAKAWVSDQIGGAEATPELLRDVYAEATAHFAPSNDQPELKETAA
jgi:hypothetical protein